MNLNVELRQELENDHRAVENIIEAAFGRVDESDLVVKLRKSDAFIPDLSILAEDDQGIIGHVLFTLAHIVEGDREVETLAMAPVSVDPCYQRRGVGIKLVEEGLRVAKSLGYESVIVLGHPAYYPRFGFTPASRWGIVCPFPSDDDAFMGLELNSHSLSNVSGEIRYAPEFMG